MIQEFLVVLACSQSQGCSQTTSAYYNSHPEIKAIVKNVDTKAKALAGPELVMVTPMALYTVTKKGSISITKYVSLQIQNNSVKSVSFQFTF